MKNWLLSAAQRPHYRVDYGYAICAGLFLFALPTFNTLCFKRCGSMSSGGPSPILFFKYDLLLIQRMSDLEVSSRELAGAPCLVYSSALEIFRLLHRLCQIL